MTSDRLEEHSSTLSELTWRAFGKLSIDHPSIHYPLSYLGPDLCGSRHKQNRLKVFLADNTSSNSSQGIPESSQARWDMYALQHVLGLSVQLGGDSWFIWQLTGNSHVWPKVLLHRLSKLFFFRFLLFFFLCIIIKQSHKLCMNASTYSYKIMCFHLWSLMPVGNPCSEEAR